MAFDILLRELAKKELKAIRIHERRRILSAIDRQLKREPKKETRNRKPLLNVSPDFEFDPPLWELRVGDYRVFYDVNEADETVQVRAVRWEARRRHARYCMKKTTIERFKEDPEKDLATAQEDRLVVTRNGKPIALILGLTNYDAEDWGYMTSASFWREVREWRKQPTVRLEDVKEELLRDN
jgi:mRNA-degrading endonuclease RelE of RelBE toxin-antitoxin system